MAVVLIGVDSADGPRCNTAKGGNRCAGTTFSSLAYLDSQLVPCVVSDTSGHTVIPSVIYFDEGSIIVGDTALELAKQNGSRAVQFVKLHMGDEWRFTGKTKSAGTKSS